VICSRAKEAVAQVRKEDEGRAELFSVGSDALPTKIWPDADSATLPAIRPNRPPRQSTSVPPFSTPPQLLQHQLLLSSPLRRFEGQYLFSRCASTAVQPSLRRSRLTLNHRASRSPTAPHSRRFLSGVRLNANASQPPTTQKFYLHHPHDSLNKSPAEDW